MKRHHVFAFAGLTSLLLAPAAASAAPAGNETVHDHVQFSEPTLGFCDGSPGTLSVDADLVVHVTLTQSTYNEKAHLRGDFAFVPDDPGEPSVSGHFVDHDLISMNFGQLKGARTRHLTRAVGVTEDGERLPILVTTAINYYADGSVEVLVDEVRCGSDTVAQPGAPGAHAPAPASGSQLQDVRGG